MAQAKLNFKTETHTEEKRVVTQVETEVTDSVTLTLTLDEARTLHTLLRNVGGHPETTRRGECDNMRLALEATGVGYYQSETYGQRAWEGGIFFNVDSKRAEVVKENLPQPKVTREDICGSTSVKPKLRVGARICITNPWVNSPYRAGQEFIVTGTSITDGAYFFDSDGVRQYVASDEFEVIA